MRPKGPATSHLETGFLGFSFAFKQAIRNFYGVLLMKPSQFKFNNIKPPSTVKVAN
jgi:hypothetical protein